MKGKTITNGYRQEEQDNRIGKLEDSVYGDKGLIKSTAEVKTNVEWLVWAVRIIFIGLITSVGVSLINLILNLVKTGGAK